METFGVQSAQAVNVLLRVSSRLMLVGSVIEGVLQFGKIWVGGR